MFIQPQPNGEHTSPILCGDGGVNLFVTILRVHKRNLISRREQTALTEELIAPANILVVEGLMDTLYLSEPEGLWFLSV